MKLNTKFENASTITDAIEAAESRCSARVFSDWAGLDDEIRALEIELSKILPKSHWRGLEVMLYADCGTVAASYNGSPMATRAKIVRGANAWFLVEVSRDYLQTKRFRVLNLASKSDEILSAAFRKF